MDDITDHGGIVNGFQWQNENGKQASIIQNVKVHYHKLFMQSLLANMDCTSSASVLARTVLVLDAVIWIGKAVKKLLPETVARCFEKAGFFTGEVTASVENENDQQDL